MVKNIQFLLFEFFKETDKNRYVKVSKLHIKLHCYIFFKFTNLYKYN